jgi:SAM-dependent methyltransferase
MISSSSSRRFDAIAANYVASEVHAASPTISKLHELLGSEYFPVICDVACGVGHFGLSFAGKAGTIVGVDPAPNMLRAMEKLAAKRGLRVETANARAEALPFADGVFDLTLCRLAAHHFTDIAMAVAEMQRVTRIGGRVVIIDLEGPAEAAAANLNHTIERLHDPTHVRSYPVAEWLSLFSSAGLVVEQSLPGLREFPDGLSVQRWCEISASGIAAENEIRTTLQKALPEQLLTLAIRRDGNEFFLSIPAALILGRKSTMRTIKGG